MTMKVRVQARITGRVQGVWYRQSTLEQAQRLGLAGWVRNRADSSVEELFEGEQEAVGKMLDWCRQGPPLAVVDNIDTALSEPEDLAPPFQVRPSA
jgi:acylphosphatase